MKLRSKHALDEEKKKAFEKLRKVLRNRKCSLETKKRVLDRYMISIFFLTVNVGQSPYRSGKKKIVAL